MHKKNQPLVSIWEVKGLPPKLRVHARVLRQGWNYMELTKNEIQKLEKIKNVRKLDSEITTLFLKKGVK